MVQVEGTVRSAGQPVSGVLVTFIPQDEKYGHLRSLGMTNENGEFKLATEQQVPGALSGMHRVTIEDLAIYQAPRSPDGTVTKLPPVRVAPQYSSPQRSPLNFELKQQSQPQTIEVELAAP